LKEESRLRVFKNRGLGEYLGLRESECRKLHNEEHNDPYTSPYTTWVIKLRWAGHVARMWEKRIQRFDGETWGKETIWKAQA
jgi:hypothetical protein